MARIVRYLCITIALFSGALINHAAAAVDKRGLERAFHQWIETDIWPDAKAAGVSRDTFETAFRGVELDWKLPELQPPGAPVNQPQREHQAEFGSPGAYFNERRLDDSVAHGRARLSKWKTTLAAIEQRYGVPAGIIVGIWARESSFGRASIPHATIKTLSTHAYIGRRPDLFRRELIAALQIVQSGDMTATKMKSSWAGGLGQPQFLPSQFLTYAVDFDGDGKRDIWNSVPDSLASIANYLRGVGWNPERDWGLEVRLPENISCTLEGPEQGMPIKDWVGLGVTGIDGTSLPANDRRVGYLLLPAGHFGPAFIVSENFYVLKKYNFSDLYALYVGHLADRLGKNQSFSARWGKVGGFTRADVRRMQLALEALNHDVGGADGLVGFKTRIAVGRWQTSAGQTASCFPDANMVKTFR